MARPVESMLEGLRSSLVRSHVGAAVILFLLAYAFEEALGVVMLPAWGVAQIVSAVLVHFGILFSTLLGDGYWQLRLLRLALALAKIVFYYGLAWLFSHWVYGMRPVPALAQYRNVLSRKPHA